MMPKLSAGILMYRFRESKLEVFLVHPGGPFWAKKDKGAWSIPKGEFEQDEDPLVAAIREFQEETGILIDGSFFELGELRQPSRKIVHAWAIQGDADPSQIISNTFELEWPPKSGKYKDFPEIDRASWFTISLAKDKLLKGQIEFIDRLIEKLGIPSEEIRSEENDPEEPAQLGLCN